MEVSPVKQSLFVFFWQGKSFGQQRWQSWYYMSGFCQSNFNCKHGSYIELTWS